MSMASRFLAAQGRRRAAAALAGRYACRPRSFFLQQQQLGAFSTSSTQPPLSTVVEPKDAVELPSHLKFRMPDLDFQDVGSGKGGTTLTKWYIQEGEEVKDGAQMCEIDTPDLCFQLESGDEGFIARLLVAEGTHDVAPGQPLAIIVPTEAEIEPFVSALKENPHCIEGYVEPTEATPVLGAESTESTAPPTESAASSDVLRVLHKLQKEGRFEDEKLLKVLKSLARKNDDQLLTTYKGSFADGVLEEAAFDKDFFVENALELAEEALQQAATGKVE